jgi:hypothetical protein
MGVLCTYLKQTRQKGDSVMQPQISICRKRENLYFKLKGNFNQTSSAEILHAVKKLVIASLEISSPDDQVCFTFQTHARIDLPTGKR